MENGNFWELCTEKFVHELLETEEIDIYVNYILQKVLPNLNDHPHFRDVQFVKWTKALLQRRYNKVEYSTIQKVQLVLQTSMQYNCLNEYFMLDDHCMYYVDSVSYSQNAKEMGENKILKENLVEFTNPFLVENLVYWVSNCNGLEGWVEKMDERLECLDKTTEEMLNVMYYMSDEYLMEVVPRVLVPKLENCVKKLVDSSVERGVFHALLGNVEQILNMGHVMEQWKVLQGMKWRYAYHLLKSTKCLEMRLHGVYDIVDMVGVLSASTKKRENEKKGMVNWLMEYPILEIVFDKNHHAEVIKRITPILVFCLQQGCLDRKDYELMWTFGNTTNSAATKATLEVLYQLVTYMDDVQLGNLVSLYTNSENVIEIYDSNDRLYLLVEATKHAPNRVVQHVMQWYWSSLPKEYAFSLEQMDVVVHYFAEIAKNVSVPGDTLLQVLQSCTDVLKQTDTTSSTTLLSTKLLGKLFKSQVPAIHESCEKFSASALLQASLEEYARYKAIKPTSLSDSSILKESDDQTVEVDGYAHREQVRIRLLSLQAICQKSFNDLTPQNMAILWDAGVEHAWTMQELSFCLNWIEYGITCSGANYITMEVATWLLHEKMTTKAVQNMISAHYSCFLTLFRYINVSLGNLGSLESDQDVLLSHENLEGINTLWKIACCCLDENIAKQAIKELVHFYTLEPGRLNDFISHAMDNLESKQSASIKTRAILLLQAVQDGLVKTTPVISPKRRRRRSVPTDPFIEPNDGEVNLAESSLNPVTSLLDNDAYFQTFLTTVEDPSNPAAGAMWEFMAKNSLRLNATFLENLQTSSIDTKIKPWCGNPSSERNDFSNLYSLYAISRGILRGSMADDQKSTWVKEFIQQDGFKYVYHMLQQWTPTTEGSVEMERNQLSLAVEIVLYTLQNASTELHDFLDDQTHLYTLFNSCIKLSWFYGLNESDQIPIEPLDIENDTVAFVNTTKLDFGAQERTKTLVVGSISIVCLLAQDTKLESYQLLNATFDAGRRREWTAILLYRTQQAAIRTHFRDSILTLMQDPGSSTLCERVTFVREWNCGIIEMLSSILNSEMAIDTDTSTCKEYFQVLQHAWQATKDDSILPYIVESITSSWCLFPLFSSTNCFSSKSQSECIASSISFLALGIKDSATMAKQVRQHTPSEWNSSACWAVDFLWETIWLNPEGKTFSNSLYESSMELQLKMPNCLNQVIMQLEKIVVRGKSIFESLHQDQDEKPKKFNFNPFQEKKQDGYPVGLWNPGCTCYMNSLIQQLFATEKFRENVLSYSNDKPDKEFVDELQKVMVALKHSQRYAFDPTSFCLSHKDLDGQPTDLNEQMDANEFLCLLLDRLSEQKEEIVNESFGGTLVNQILIADDEVPDDAAKYTSEREEKFFTLSVDIKNQHSLEKSLESYFQKELLEGDNSYFSDKLNRKVSATKRVCLDVLPETLVIHLKRFEFDFNTMTKEKINDYFEFPDLLDIKQYTKSHLKFIEQGGSQGEDVCSNYHLSGIVVHSGTSETGHYYSFIEENTANNEGENSWFEYNDQTIRPFDANDIVAECYGGTETINNWNPEQQAYEEHLLEKERSAYMLIYKLGTSSIKNQHVEKEMSSQVQEYLRQVRTENTALSTLLSSFHPSLLTFMVRLLQQPTKLSPESEIDLFNVQMEYGFGIVLFRAVDASELQAARLEEAEWLSEFSNRFLNIGSSSHDSCNMENVKAFLSAAQSGDWCNLFLVICEEKDIRHSFAELLHNLHNQLTTAFQSGQEELLPMYWSFMVNITKLLTPLRVYWRHQSEYLHVLETIVPYLYSNYSKLNQSIAMVTEETMVISNLISYIHNTLCQEPADLNQLHLDYFSQAIGILGYALNVVYSDFTSSETESFHLQLSEYIGQDSMHMLIDQQFLYDIILHDVLQESTTGIIKCLSYGDQVMSCHLLQSFFVILEHELKQDDDEPEMHVERMSRIWHEGFSTVLALQDNEEDSKERLELFLHEESGMLAILKAYFDVKQQFSKIEVLLTWVCQFFQKDSRSLTMKHFQESFDWEAQTSWVIDFTFEDQSRLQIWQNFVKSFKPNTLGDEAVEELKFSKEANPEMAGTLNAKGGQKGVESSLTSLSAVLEQTNNNDASSLRKMRQFQTNKNITVEEDDRVEAYSNNK